jgi:murein DD-endopeptidase MepM/ murein hydrolase activator NlpD
MTLRRVLTTGLAAAGLYVAALAPAGALAQDPTPTASSSATATAAATETATPTPDLTPTSTATPDQTSTATPDPTETATASPDASPSPEPTALPSPTATVQGGSSAGTGTTGTAGAAGDPGTVDTNVKVDVGAVTVDLTGSAADPNPKTRNKGGSVVECKKHRKGKGSTSTSGQDCRVKDTKTPPTNSDGSPTNDNPSLSVAAVGPAPIGVPNFFIEKFRIPPFLLPIYQAAGIQYGIRWEVLAAINEIETDYGRNLNISVAGAQGWMQFMPSTWKRYGVDANKDGVSDPYNPVDAIFAAARYLKAAGGQQDLRRAIFAYNHANWYVDSVMLRARLIGGLPADFVGSLTGLTQARFPVQAAARYAGAVSTKPSRTLKGRNAALPVESQANRTGIDIFAKKGAPVVAVNDGKIVGLGRNARLGNYIRLQDAYGNVFTYGHLAKVARTYPAPRVRHVSQAQVRRELKLNQPKADAAPTSAASDTSKAAPKRAVKAATKAPRPTVTSSAAPLGKDRLFANPRRVNARAAGGDLQLAENNYKPTAGAALKLNRADYVAKPMRKGAKVIGGTVLGRIGRVSKQVAPHVHFEIRPAGRGAPRIDPKPILDGWKLLESTELYRAAGKNALVGPDAKELTIGQVLLMSKEALQQHVLANPRIDIYQCGRRDIRLGLIDRRVLATLEFLASSGLKPTVSALECGHGLMTTSGNVSEHASGNAVDIAAVNGITISPATQGPGSITEMTIQRLLTLQGTMKPHQIISLMTFQGTDNTLAMADHADHIHVGFRPLYGTNTKQARQVNAVLKPKQWIKLVNRLSAIANPVVPTTPSRYAVKVGAKPAAAGSGD